MTSENYVPAIMDQHKNPKLCEMAFWRLAPPASTPEQQLDVDTSPKTGESTLNSKQNQKSIYFTAVAPGRAGCRPPARPGSASKKYSCESASPAEARCRGSKDSSRDSRCTAGSPAAPMRRYSVGALPGRPCSNDVTMLGYKKHHRLPRRAHASVQRRRLAGEALQGQCKWLWILKWLAVPMRRYGGGTLLGRPCSGETRNGPA